MNMDDPYIADFVNRKYHVSQLISCPYRVLNEGYNYHMMIGEIFDLGVKAYYLEKGYKPDVRIRIPVKDTMVIGTIDLMDDRRIVEVKLSNFNEVTITKGLQQVSIYKYMYKLIYGVEKTAELWVFGLSEYKIFRPRYSERIWNKVIERLLFIETWRQKHNSIPRIPSYFDCKVCRLKFNCPYYFKTDAFKQLQL